MTPPNSQFWKKMHQKMLNFELSTPIFHIYRQEIGVTESAGMTSFRTVNRLKLPTSHFDHKRLKRLAEKCLYLTNCNTSKTAIMKFINELGIVWFVYGHRKRHDR
jgi:transcriptional accessory protein Tex/SPT6